MFFAPRTTMTRCLACFVLVLGACGRDQSSAKPEDIAAYRGPIAAEHRAFAQQLYALRCTPCHGGDGSGNSSLSKSGAARPPDFRDPGFQASRSDDAIERILVVGGAAMGKNAVMPANPDLASQPEARAALREQLRSFAAKDRLR